MIDLSSFFTTDPEKATVTHADVLEWMKRASAAQDNWSCSISVETYHRIRYMGYPRDARHYVDMMRRKRGLKSWHVKRERYGRKMRKHA